MKSVYSILMLLAAVQIAFSQCVPTTVLRQNNWRWRNNDGNEIAATWKAPEKSPITYNNGVLRLRVEIVSLSRGYIGVGTVECPFRSVQPLDTLQYATDTSNAGSWTSIGNDPSKAFRLAGTNAFVVQNEVTTAQINSTNYFSSGRMMVSDSVISNMTLFALASYGATRTEMEWAIVGTPNLLPNTTYYFRQGWNIYQYWTGSRYIYSTYPTLTTTAPLPVKLTRFMATAADKKVRLQWTTATEQNSDRFEVQRSTDQRIWQTTAMVKGKGNTNTATDYTAYDENPISGISCYRLQQFDKDGKSSLSEVRLLRTRTGNTPQFAVIQNPVQGVVRFVNTEMTVDNVTATVSDAGGKIVYRQVFGSIPNGGINTLNMIAPSPGIYLLQLKSSKTVKTIRLIIQ